MAESSRMSKFVQNGASSAGGFWRVESPLLFAIFLDLIGFGMSFPDLQLRAADFARAAGFKGVLVGAIVGLLLSTYFLVQILASPKWGRLSDRIGRKPVLLFCTALSAISMLVYAFATGIAGILLSRILAGLAAANVVVGQAYVADTTTEANRAAKMGRIGAAITIGLIAGPAIGGELAAMGGNKLMGLAAAGASTLSFLWLLITLPRARPTEVRSPGTHPMGDLRLIFDIPALKKLFLLGAISWFALACLEGTFGRLIELKLGYGQSEFGRVFSFESAAGALAGLAVGRLAFRYSPSAILKAAYLMLAVGLMLTPFAGNLGEYLGFAQAWIRPPLLALFIITALSAFGLGLANPTLSTLCSNVTPEARQGEMFGLLQSARSIGFLAGPLLGGILFELLPEGPYFLAGIVGLFAAFLVTAPSKADGARQVES